MKSDLLPGRLCQGRATRLSLGGSEPSNMFIASSSHYEHAISYMAYDITGQRFLAAPNMHIAVMTNSSRHS